MPKGKLTFGNQSEASGAAGSGPCGPGAGCGALVGTDFGARSLLCA